MNNLDMVTEIQKSFKINLSVFSKLAVANIGRK
jgi:hypothetical protein